MTEAMWYFVGPGRAYDHLALLAIASLNYGSGQPSLLKRNRSFLRWAPDLFDLSLIAQSEFTDVFLSLMQKQQIVPMTYTRIPSADVSSEQQAYIKLDLAVPRSIALINQFAAATYHKYRQNPAMQEFFAAPKTYRVKP